MKNNLINSESLRLETSSTSKEYTFRVYGWQRGRLITGTLTLNLSLENQGSKIRAFSFSNMDHVQL